MTESISKHHRNLSAILHASTFSRYFIPFGQFLAPLLLWSINKKDSDFVDYNGKQALNFQISMLLYSIVLGAICVPFFIGMFPEFLDNFSFWDWGWHGDINWHWDSRQWWRNAWPLGAAGFFQFVLTAINIIYTILATIRTSEGQTFKYPMTINFIK